MFLTLCSHYTVPPWWKQSFHPCFECALHSKTDRFNCTHSYSARQCSDPCISEQSSALMNEASYCMYNIQHFISFLEAAQLRLRIFFPLPGIDRGTAALTRSEVGCLNRWTSRRGFYCHYLLLNKSIQLQIVKSKEAIPGIYMKVLRTHEMSASLQRRRISQLFQFFEL